LWYFDGVISCGKSSTLSTPDFVVAARTGVCQSEVLDDNPCRGNSASPRRAKAMLILVDFHYQLPEKKGSLPATKIELRLSLVLSDEECTPSCVPTSLDLSSHWDARLVIARLHPRRPQNHRPCLRFLRTMAIPIMVTYV
jgi:hypothetical protein